MNLNQQLPQHSPPDWIWDKIEDQLPEREVVMRPLWQQPLWRYAAALVVLLGVGWWTVSRWQEPEAVISYSQEKIVAPQKENTVEEKYKVIVAYCQTQTEVCENPKVKALKSELDELSVASERLKTAIGNYNTEPALVAQLTAIEQERDVIMGQLKPFLKI